MFTFANVVHFFTHKFSGLIRRGFALPPVAPGPFESLFFWHSYCFRLQTTSFGLSASRETSLNGVLPSRSELRLSGEGILAARAGDVPPLWQSQKLHAHID
jgi:hypothetical protein